MRLQAPYCIYLNWLEINLLIIVQEADSCRYFLYNKSGLRCFLLLNCDSKVGSLLFLLLLVFLAYQPMFLA